MAYKTNMMRMSISPPPWVSDPVSAPFWVTLPQAGEHYFRRTYKAMRAKLLAGEFDEFGFPTFFDGARWWIRLPCVLPENTKKDSQ